MFLKLKIYHWGINEILKIKKKGGDWQDNSLGLK